MLWPSELYIHCVWKIEGCSWLDFVSKGIRKCSQTTRTPLAHSSTVQESSVNATGQVMSLGLIPPA